KHFYLPNGLQMQRRNRMLCVDAEVCSCVFANGGPTKCSTGMSFVTIESDRRYDEFGNLKSFVDARGFLTTMEYDADCGGVANTSHIVPHKLANGTITSIDIASRTKYDAAGRVSQIIDTNGNITRFTRDMYGRATSAIHATGMIERFS